MNRDYQRVAQAISYIEQHKLGQPTLAQVAEAMHLSPAHAQRVFSRWAGISPKQFLQYLTVQHAKGLLDQSQSLLHSAHASGLSGSGRLHDHFVQLEAMSPREYRDGGEGLELRYGIAATPFGDGLVAQTSRGGVCHLSFIDGESAPAIAELQAQWPAALWCEDSVLAETLLEPLLGASRSSVPITLQLPASNFRLQVWRALLRVPEGTIMSYQQLAAVAGQPRAVRAVASAVASNPVAWLIPCHRVIRSSGEIGNYRWSAPRKRAMLAWEQGGLNTGGCGAPG